MRAIFANGERIQKLRRYDPIPTKLGSVIFEATLPQFADKIELSHTVRQARIVMPRPAKEALPNVPRYLSK
jgi:hypothetical protein